MPYRSEAQSRYMHMKHPGIASRWDSEMRQGKKGNARRHPIKAAGLPDHVDKGLVSRVLRRAPKKVAGPVVRTGVTRAGTVGVEFEHQGVKGWGRNHEAARAAWQNNSMAKRDSWEVPMGHFAPELPNKRPNYGTGNTVGKRMTGAVTGVAKPKKLQPTRVAPRRAQAALPIGVPPIPPSQVGKRDRSFNPEHNRQRRLGAAAALTGAGGLALAGRGAHGVRRATALARHDAAYDEGLLGYLHDHKTVIRSPKRGKKGAIISEPTHTVDRSESNALHRLGTTRPGHMIAKPTRRQGAQIGGGAALTASGAGLAGYGRSRANREYH